MCLIVFAFDYHPRYTLILAANRDEYFSRPTVEAGFWEGVPSLFAGRDLKSGGTWLGVTPQGKLAAVTNYRDPSNIVHNPVSRGRLVTQYLECTETALEYARYLQEIGPRCDGFNIILGDAGALYHYSNRNGTPISIPVGVHGLSNSLLDTPWPKVMAAKERFSDVIRSDAISTEGIFSMMSGPEPFSREDLPDTGIGIDREILLSPIFIRGKEYGTRSTTLLLIDRNRVITFIERTYLPGGAQGKTVTKVLNSENMD